MKHFLLLCTLTALLIATSAGIVGDAFAQPARIKHTVYRHWGLIGDPGRDLWFTLLDNGDDSIGKYDVLFVTSPNITNVHVHITGGVTKTIQVQPYQMATFNIPTSWEMTTSGIVQPSGIHVWSNDADIACTVMSHSPYSSDGMRIIQVTEWGSDYVVAASAAEYPDSATHDYPSEFAIVANQDSTILTITPTADIRREFTRGAACDTLAHPKGVPFTDTLMAGESIQYKTMCAIDTVHFDFTGTVVHANHPVGLIAGAMRTNIPTTYPTVGKDSGSFICEMIPAVKSWANNYYTVPFMTPPGSALSHAASRFLVVASKAGQVVQRYDNDGQTDRGVFTATKQYDFVYLDSIGQGSRWSSDAPFLLVQYMYSTSYPDGITGQGAASEMVVLPPTSFSKDAVFQIPVSIGNIVPYTGYVTIIAKPGDKSVKVDGASVVGLNSVYIDSIYSGYRASNLKPGGHVVMSDSGVGVYVYGYGYQESYSWPVTFATTTYSTNDTILPEAAITGSCLDAHVVLSDTGAGQTQLYYFRVETLSNMGYALDSTWVDGTPQGVSYYDMHVVDPDKSAILTTTSYDGAGNYAMVTSTYSPQLFCANQRLDFGSIAAGNSVTLYDTIVNTGAITDPITYLDLKYGDRGFTIDSMDRMPLAPGQRQLLKIRFTPQSAQPVMDTLLVRDLCMTAHATLLGNGAALGVEAAQAGSTAPRVVVIPNPAENAATLRYSLGQPSDVTIELLTILGSTVHRENYHESSGEHTRLINLSTLPNGIYVYRFVVGSEVQSGELIIAK